MRYLASIYAHDLSALAFVALAEIGGLILASAALFAACVLYAYLERRKNARTKR